VKKVGAVIVFDITKDGTFQQSWSKKFFLLLNNKLLSEFKLLMVNKVLSMMVNQKKEQQLK